MFMWAHMEADEENVFLPLPFCIVVLRHGLPVSQKLSHWMAFTSFSGMFSLVRASLIKSNMVRIASCQLLPLG